jgi:hypothetical protein
MMKARTIMTNRNTTTHTDAGRANHSQPGKRTRATGATVMVLTALLLILSVGIAGALEARVTSVSGKVEMRVPDGSWSPAEVNMVVPLGATVSTGFNSSAVLEIGPATLQVRALSRMRIDELVEQEGLVQSDLHLEVGRVRADVRSAEGIQSEFRLSSPIATAAVRGTAFEFDGVNIQVVTGRVQLANQFNETVAVGGGESSSAGGDEPPTPPAEAQEAAATVEAFVAGADSAPRTEGVRSGSSGNVGGLRIDWTITDWEEG